LRLSNNKTAVTSKARSAAPPTAPPMAGPSMEAPLDEELVPCSPFDVDEDATTDENVAGSAACRAAARLELDMTASMVAGETRVPAWITTTTVMLVVAVRRRLCRTERHEGSSPSSVAKALSRCACAADALSWLAGRPASVTVEVSACWSHSGVVVGVSVVVSVVVVAVVAAVVVGIEDAAEVVVVVESEVNATVVVAAVVGLCVVVAAEVAEAVDVDIDDVDDVTIVSIVVVVVGVCVEVVAFVVVASVVVEASVPVVTATVAGDSVVVLLPRPTVGVVALVTEAVVPFTPLEAL
jgi:hypothetical protein